MRTLLVAGAILITTLTASPVTAAPPPPQAEVQVDCVTATVATSGWPEGSEIIFGLGEVNGGVPLNTTQTYPVKGNEWNSYYADGLYWSLIIHTPDQIDAVRQFGVVYCAAPVAVIDTAGEPMPTPVFEPSPLWPGLELAAPW